MNKILPSLSRSLLSIEHKLPNSELSNLFATSMQRYQTPKELETKYTMSDFALEGLCFPTSKELLKGNSAPTQMEPKEEYDFVKDGLCFPPNVGMLRFPQTPTPKETIIADIAKKTLTSKDLAIIPTTPKSLAVIPSATKSTPGSEGEDPTGSTASPWPLGLMALVSGAILMQELSKEKKTPPQQEPVVPMQKIVESTTPPSTPLALEPNSFYWDTAAKVTGVSLFVLSTLLTVSLR